VTNYFDGMIGQDALKRKLSFHIDAFKTTRTLPFFLFNGPRGNGKTAFMRRLAGNITNADGSKRTYVEVNCSIIKNNATFFENIFLQHLHDREATMAFDECHNLPNDLAQALLTICNTENDPVREFQWGDGGFVFDFTKLVFMFATTEPDQLFPPLKDRLDVVDFEPYKVGQLMDIVKAHAEDVHFEGNALQTIAENLRGNARSCVKAAGHVLTYCQKNRTFKFGPWDWVSLCHDLSILPYGLTASEVMVLDELNKRGPCSLNMLASATGLSRSALQRDVEQYLMKKDMMRIDGKRKLTKFGLDTLTKIRQLTPASCTK
jgi:Holliday junction resolvasome RuvABC ATP-dependent DNA helicase subunit